MKHGRIFFPLIRVPLDIVTIGLGFLLARDIRALTDGIPWVHLPIQTIGSGDLIWYAFMSILLFLSIQASREMYRLEYTSEVQEELLRFGGNTFLWFLIFIGCVYLSLGFTGLQEIPRLIILFACIFHLFAGILWRLIITYLERYLTRKGVIPRERLLVIGNIDAELSHALFFVTKKECMDKTLEADIRSHRYDTIFLWENIWAKSDWVRVIELAKVYGIRCIQMVVPWVLSTIPREIIEWNGVPVVRFSSITITPGERFLKRLLDIFVSLICMIFLSPLLLLIAGAIWIEDSSGPIIYRNRRVWIRWNLFTLYKFRYMYWKYCIKDAYSGENDGALEFEQKLRDKQNTRKWPVYKIEDDPRRTHVGKFIERFSLDELPQLWNIFRWDMSLVWPRAHQPREVEHYEEYQYQVMTIKPWLTGMAQVHGRDANEFAHEAKLDIFYIEHYSLWLDVSIILRTLYVVLRRWFTVK